MQACPRPRRGVHLHDNLLGEGLLVGGFLVLGKRPPCGGAVGVPHPHLPHHAVLLVVPQPHHAVLLGPGMDLKINN